MPIRCLPTLLVNQIAAGEVIERPASVVKELVENAIDAGATRIDVAIEQGGKERIRVSDDGGGIPFDELALALAPHATSKIETAADLDRVATMGFRGEALASIASVSRLSCLSRPSGQDEAGLVEGEGADLGGPRPASGPPGTTVTVRNLFFNTPARRKFLRTDQTEAARGLETVRRLALAHPAIAFTHTADGQVRLKLRPNQSARDRALDVLGPELADELVEVTGHADGIGLWGLAGTPSLARPTSKHARVYVNGRPVQDRSITHAIREAYRGLIEPTRTPTIVLFLEVEPGAVDVNVHPTKAEVRFRHQAAVHRAVLDAVRAGLRERDLVPALDLSSAAADPGAGRSDPGPGLGTGAGSWGGRAGGGGGGGPAAAAAIVETLQHLGSREKGFVYSEMRQALAREAPELLGAGETPADPGGDEPAALPTGRAAATALQVHDSYIVTEDEQGMLIIDQHALHERIMFEQLKGRVEQGPLESQRMLMPARVEVDDAQREALAGLEPLLARLGIEAKPDGPAAVAVHAFTTLLFERNVDPVAFVGGLLATMAEQQQGETRERPGTEQVSDDPEAILHEVLDMMACKAAVKAGDRLEPGEIDALLRQRESVERGSSCPHGRPTTLRLSLEDLERQFGRR